MTDVPRAPSCMYALHSCLRDPKTQIQLTVTMTQMDYLHGHLRSLFCEGRLIKAVARREHKRGVILFEKVVDHIQEAA